MTYTTSLSSGRTGGRLSACGSLRSRASGSPGLWLPTGSCLPPSRAAPIAFRAWRAFARYSPVLAAGRLVAVGTVNKVPAEVRAGYDAPFPDPSYQAGARAFPQLVPTTPNDPAVRANRAAWDALGHWEKPFLAVFGARDPIFRRADRLLIEHIPGAPASPTTASGEAISCRRTAVPTWPPESSPGMRRGAEAVSAARPMQAPRHTGAVLQVSGGEIAPTP